VWIDIDNPPQVQYMLPFRAAFSKAGAEVFVTARAYGITADLISGQGAEARIVGAEFGRSKLWKAVGTLERARGLVAACGAWGRPTAVISSSRAAALAGWWMGISQFALLDYEHVDLGVYRQTGCYIIHPDLIPVEFFLERGFRRSRLLPFRGLKEDISFSTVKLAPLQREPQPRKVTRFLIRPPAEESHYYVSGSGAVTREVLGFLSGRSDVQVLFSPRHPWQRSYLEGLQWVLDPVLLDHAVPFPGFLREADAMISAGGTMLREAAYVGVPAFSTFQGVAGAVDLHLEAQGRLVFIRSSQDFGRLLPAALVERAPMDSHPTLVTDLVREISSRITGLAHGAYD
jgi:uncharacterized protein